MVPVICTSPTAQSADERVDRHHRGNGTAGFGGDNGPATDASLGSADITVELGGLAVDTVGNLYLADVPNARVRKVTASGIIVTVAGNGVFGYNGDGGPATGAQLALGYRSGVAVDAAGNLYIADSGNQRVRQVLPGGPITTIAGNGGLGAPGNNIAAIATTLSFPTGLTFDNTHNLYITDYGVVQRRSPGGSLTTIAGNGVCCGFSGDGGPALQAQVNASAVAVDNGGNVFIVDEPSQRIRRVTPGGTVNTVAGNGAPGNSTGDGGPAVSARFSAAGALAADTRGNLFVIDGNLVRKIAPTVAEPRRKNEEDQLLRLDLRVFSNRGLLAVCSLP
jgi:sugar lactone lactonase YvrE